MAAHSTSREANGLLAILLITRSRPGPKLVFHYPPHAERELGHRKAKATHKDEDGLSASESDSDADYSDRIHQARQRGESNSTVRHVGLGEEAFTDSPDQVLGVDIESLEKLLAPGRWSEKKKFEVSLDGVTYVGLPVFAKDDGSRWSKRVEPTTQSKTHREPSTEVSSTSGDNHEGFENDEAIAGSAGAAGIAGITITRPEQPAPPPMLLDYTHMPDSLNSSNLASLGTSMNSTSTTSAVVGDQMSMFHVVFALKPSAAEGALSPKDIYDNVITRLSKALKYCQKQSNYVSLESRKLQTLKTKARLDRTPTSTLETQMLEHSELAWALKEIYTRLSLNETATIRLDGHEMSLQLPPNPSDPPPGPSLSSALLLLEDKPTLLQTLTHHSSPPLAHFIRETLPTKTLAKQAIKLGIPENTILTLAQHLVSWRKAKPISALHPRNTYIVSPAAPLAKLPALREAYARRFPALPSLESMLAMLGSKPVRFGALIQSPAHRASYVEVLAWLIRCGFVVQLKTFGWLRLAPRDGGLLAQDAAGASPSAQPDRPPGLGDDPEAGNMQNGIGPELEIIADPLRPSIPGLAAIHTMQTVVDDLDLGDRFQALLKYFDGEHAFEEMAASEGVKRARVEELLSALEKAGWLLTFRAT